MTVVVFSSVKGTLTLRVSVCVPCSFRRPYEGAVLILLLGDTRCIHFNAYPVELLWYYKHNIVGRIDNLLLLPLSCLLYSRESPTGHSEFFPCRRKVLDYSSDLVLGHLLFLGELNDKPTNICRRFNQSRRLLSMTIYKTYNWESSPDKWFCLDLIVSQWFRGSFGTPSVPLDLTLFFVVSRPSLPNSPTLPPTRPIYGFYSCQEKSTKIQKGIVLHNYLVYQIPRTLSHVYILWNIRPVGMVLKRN